MTPTRAEFHVLLALLDGPRHGYGLMQDVEELSAGRLQIGPGTLYTAIKRLRTARLISETGAGYTWAGNSQANRLTPWSNDPVTDPAGEVVYLRDETTGQFWTPTPLPAGKSPAQWTTDLLNGQVEDLGP